MIQNTESNERSSLFREYCSAVVACLPVHAVRTHDYVCVVCVCMRVFGGEGGQRGRDRQIERERQTHREETDIKRGLVFGF